MAQRSVNNSARVYVFISTKEENFATTTGLNSMTPIEAKDVLLARNDLLGEWGTNIKELVTAACEDDAAYDPTMKFDFKPLYSLPVGHRWPHNPCATVIGDAAHLINPVSSTTDMVKHHMLINLILGRWRRSQFGNA